MRGGAEEWIHWFPYPTGVPWWDPATYLLSFHIFAFNQKKECLRAECLHSTRKCGGAESISLKNIQVRGQYFAKGIGIPNGHKMYAMFEEFKKFQKKIRQWIMEAPNAVFFSFFFNFFFHPNRYFGLKTKLISDLRQNREPKGSPDVGL